MQRGLKVIAAPKDVGKIILLRAGTCVCGRLPESQLYLPGEKVSKKHCMFSLDIAGFSVKDLGSSNGTFVNGVVISEVKLKAGDRLQIGEYLLEVVAGGKA